MKNKGFSFVELIVAVAILGIVSLPIASSFVLAARIEAKAAILARINDAADDVMLLLTESDTLDTEAIETDCSCETHDLYHVLSCIYSRDLKSVSRGEGENDNLYTLTYNGYTVMVEITALTDFSRIDLTIDHEANGSTYHVTRKGVLSHVAS